MDGVKWIKLYLNIFEDEKIIDIRHLPRGYEVIYIWLNLLVLAGKSNADGNLVLSNKKPYLIKNLANLLGFSLKFTEKSLKILTEYSMINRVEIDGIEYYHITNWAKYQNIESLDRIRENDRKRSAKYRENKRKNVTQK